MKMRVAGYFKLYNSLLCESFAALPVPYFSAASINGGNITITLNGWKSGSAAKYYHWPSYDVTGPILNGPVANVCSPSRNSPCPAPIYGYKIKSMGAQCGIGPANGLASAWTSGDAGCTIIGRTTIPSGYCTMPIPAQECIYLATQLVLADGRTSYYVSANSIGIWVGSSPGVVKNNFILSKSASNLNFSWLPAGGTCDVTCYNLYQGTLPWTGYNHTPIACCTAGTAYSIALPANSHYYLVVPANADKEGSYGTDSSSNPIPQSTSACRSQNAAPCN